jgi:hypothetical protein
MRCLHVLGYSIGSAIIDTLLPVTIGIVAIGVIGFVAYDRLRHAPSGATLLGV